MWWQTRRPSLRPALPKYVYSTVRKTARRSPWQETAAYLRGVWQLTRIIHQPKKLTEEGAVGLRMMLKTVVSHERRHPPISASGCPGTVPTGLMVVIGPNASSQPPQAYSKRVAPGPSTLSTALPRAGYRRRTHANKVKLRLKTGATGHDEGNDILIRSGHACTRAPSVSQRSWIVSIVAEAHGVVFHTSRRKGSRNTEAAEGKNNRNCLASKR